MTEVQGKTFIIKIVYYGPALSGKTTNLLQLHNIVAPDKCGEMMSFETKGDRTLFFDLLPVIIRSEKGYMVKIKLFTVPGQVRHDATRKTVLSRADGVVFVADSQTNQRINNFQSFENLEKNAARVGLDIDTLPLVIQFNKRDLTDIVDKKEVTEKWSPTGLPVVFSSAINGIGVLETFQSILKEVYKVFDKEFKAEQNLNIDEDAFLNGFKNGK